MLVKFIGFQMGFLFVSFSKDFKSLYTLPLLCNFPGLFSNVQTKQQEHHVQQERIRVELLKHWNILSFDQMNWYHIHPYGNAHKKMRPTSNEYTQTKNRRTNFFFLFHIPQHRSVDICLFQFGTNRGRIVIFHLDTFVPDVQFNPIGSCYHEKQCFSFVAYTRFIPTLPTCSMTESKM